MTKQHLPKVLAPSDAGAFVFQVVACTDIIGGYTFATEYAEELLTVDPLAELVDDCLVVAQLADGRPFLFRWSRTGKGGDGRFIASGDSAEAFRLYPPGFLYAQSDLGTFIRIFGRVVGTPREFPRPLPASYRSIGRAAA